MDNIINEISIAISKFFLTHGERPTIVELGDLEIQQLNAFLVYLVSEPIYTNQVCGLDIIERHTQSYLAVK
jgi:hypothetical protein